MNHRMKIFTWHIHGSYLYYLAKGNFDIYIPVDDNLSEGYSGRGQTFRFDENVIEIPVNQVKEMEFDLILFQSHKNYLFDQFEILSESQRQLPRICIEHDPPRKSPTDTIHPVSDPDVLVVHVSHFNQLMWHNTGPTKVIVHGVVGPDVPYTGELEKGIVVVNHLHERGRRLGADIYDRVKKEITLDLVGMGTEQYGGLGEILFHDMTEFASRYRFFFNPIRYTSLGLAFCESMRSALPVVCLATTEYASIIRDGENGYAHTDIDYLIEKMKLLLDNKEMARQIGEKGKETAEALFNIDRFRREWERTFKFHIQQHSTYEKTNSTY